MSTNNSDVDEMRFGDVYAPQEAADVETICAICMAEFIDSEDLKIHIHQVHNIYKINTKFCQFCSAPYTDFMAYAIHLRDNHIATFVSCSYCTKIFTDIDNHRKHEKKHLRSFANRLYKCSQCELSFPEAHELRNHELELHNNNDDGVMLNCLQFLSAALKLKASTLLQFVGMNTVYVCVGCEYTTNRSDLYLRHAQKTDCVVYVCDKCSNTYKKKSSLQRHFTKECETVKLDIKMKQCPNCKKYLSISEFKGHKQNCSSIKCYICEIQFDTMYELSEHQSKDHPLSVELKSCRYCWKQCVGNVALQKHIDRSHKVDFHLYKYLCVYCNTAFKHPQKLFGHFYTKHKDINPYTCKICNMEFRPRKKFTIHIKLKHSSQGFVEFDRNYHVFFTDKKPENPFIPKSLYNKNGELRENAESESDQDLPTEDVKDKTDNNMTLVDCNTDYVSVTETEGNQTEVETKLRLKRKRPIKVRKVTDYPEPIAIQSSEDEPLLIVKKKVQKSSPKLKRAYNKKQLTKINKKKFTCNICDKYCYTFQNYNHHISLHSKSDGKKCIKCSRVFRSKSKLNDHIAEKHSSSKLTETLKSLLEKRKSGIPSVTEISTSEKFRRTIKKVVTEDVSFGTAKITPVENGLSVQKFIENFTPEESKDSIIKNNVSMKIVTGFYKKPTIKMTKFQPKPISTTSRLSMPIKFKESFAEKAKITIKLVQPTPVTFDDNADTSSDHYYEDNDLDRNESIPEVAEEVLLEGTEETPKPVTVPHKIVIEKFPTEFKDIRIAHLLPEAPYYKIVKVNEVLNPQKEDVTTSSGNSIKLRDGTKLVTSNPLAHLLGNKPVEKVLEPIKNKYYKPKVRNYQGMLAEALSKLDTPTRPRKKKEVKTE